MKHILLLILYLIGFEAYPQQWEWGRSVSKSQIKELTTDKDGNLILLGQLNAESNYETTTLDSGLFIAKFNSNGLFLWAKSFPTALNATIETDSDGNIIILGSYASIFLFEQFTVQSVGNNDIFLLKLNTQGAGLWLKSLGGNYSDTGTALATDSLNIYITGTTSVNLSFDNLSLNDTSENIQFTGKINADGSPVWLHKSIYENSKGIDIGVGENGNIYTLGIIDCMSYSSWVHCNQYVQKYSSTGTSMLTNIFGSPSDNSYIVCRDDQIYIHQYECSTGACYSWLTKYDTQMSQKWSRTLGTSFSDYWVNNINLGKDKSIYMTGTYAFYNTLKDSVQFDSLWMQVDHQQNFNAILAKMDTNGIFQMAIPYFIKNNGNSAKDYLCIDNFNSCYIARPLFSADTITFGQTTLNCEENYLLKFSAPELTTNFFLPDNQKIINIFPDPSSIIGILKRIIFNRLWKFETY